MTRKTRNTRKIAKSNKSHSEHANKLAIAHDIQQYCEEYNQLFTELYNRLVANLKDKLDDTKNFTSFIVAAMQLLTSEAVALHGYQKKELVIDLVKGVVDNMTISEEDKTTLKNFVFPTLDNTIDLFVAAAKGYLFFKKVGDKVEEGCNKCFAKCAGKCSGCKKTEAPKAQKAPERNLVVPRTEEGAVDVTGLSNVVYDKLRGLITHKQITIANIVGIVTLAMQLVQQFAGVEGADKKKIVINVITRLVHEFPMSEADKAAVEAIVATTLDKTIDFVVAVANGDIDLLGIVEDHVARCKAMCGCGGQ